MQKAKRRVMNPLFGFSSLGILLLSKHTRSVEKLVDRGGIAKKDLSESLNRTWRKACQDIV
jgi:hypothetical protein